MKYRLIGAAALLLSTFALGQAEAKKECPVRQFSGGCIQVITWAQNPNNGQCCQYPNPCVVPDGWQTFTGPGCTNGGIEGL